MNERREGEMAPGAAGLDSVHAERERIRAALKVRCGKVIEMAAARGRILCGLNLGHIGGCSQIAATITVSRERLEEILDG